MTAAAIVLATVGSLCALEPPLPFFGVGFGAVALVLALVARRRESSRARAVALPLALFALVASGVGVARDVHRRVVGPGGDYAVTLPAR